jgi:hypothetical protein
MDAPLLERLWCGIAKVGFAPYSRAASPEG